MKTQKNIYSQRVESTRKIRVQIHSALMQASSLEIREVSSIRIRQLNWTTLLVLDKIKLIRWSIRASLIKKRTSLKTSHHPSCYSHQVNLRLLSNRTMACKTIRWYSRHNLSPSPPSSRPPMTMNQDKATQGNVRNMAASPEDQGLTESNCKRSKMLSWTPANGTCHSWEILPKNLVLDVLKCTNGTGIARKRQQQARQWQVPKCRMRPEKLTELHTTVN